MVRINRNTLPHKEIKSLFKQLDQVLGELPSEKISTLLQNLIGPEERLMLAKRLAVIVMVKEGYSDYRIASCLKLSQSTIKNIKTRYGKGATIDIAKTLKNNKEVYEAILDVIDSLLHAGGIMPRRYGLDRYREIHR